MCCFCHILSSWRPLIVQFMMLLMMSSLCPSVRTSTSWMSRQITWTWKPSRLWRKRSTSLKWVSGRGLGHLIKCACGDFIGWSSFPHSKNHRCVKVWLFTCLFPWSDVKMRGALTLWCHVFQGGVILVSHDERLIRLVCRELWVCEGGKVARIDGGFDEYRDILQEQFRKEGYLWGPAHFWLTTPTTNITRPLHNNTCHSSQSGVVGAERGAFLSSLNCLTCGIRCWSSESWLVLTWWCHSELWQRRSRPEQGGAYLKSDCGEFIVTLNLVLFCIIESCRFEVLSAFKGPERQTNDQIKTSDHVFSLFFHQCVSSD